MALHPDIIRWDRGLLAAQVVAAIDALGRIGDDLAGRSARLAPVEEGNLRASVGVTIILNGTRFDGRSGISTAKDTARSLIEAGAQVSVDVEVSFNEVYAARQHEETSWDHPLGGQAKFLEQPFRELEPRYRTIIALAVERATLAYKREHTIGS